MNFILNYIERIMGFLPNFFIDAILDSVALIPFLFIIFVIIEIFETYFSTKIARFLKYSEKIGPIIGTILAIIPQCGFSVIATMFYIKKFISLGTLISVYIATSDEAIPILLANPEQFHIVMKIIVIKFVLAITIGYLVDFIVKRNKDDNGNALELSQQEEGCCHHELIKPSKKDLILHPLKHTLNVFFFILVVCIILNYLLEKVGVANLSIYMLQNSILQPIYIGIIGLIPNCAVSVFITLAYIKGIITFGSALAGLSANCGLGLLILIKRNDNIKNTLLIISIILSTSVLSGIILQYINF